MLSSFNKSLSYKVVRRVTGIPSNIDLFLRNVSTAGVDQEDSLAKTQWKGGSPLAMETFPLCFS